MTATPELSPEEARERFSDAVDDTLPPEERAAFEATLAARGDLAEEYAAFRRTVEAARRLGRAPVPLPRGRWGRGAGDRASVLLPGVQRKLRRRSRGRFYRDGFSQAAGGRGLLLSSVLALLILGLLLGVALLFPWPAPGPP